MEFLGVCDKIRRSGRIESNGNTKGENLWVDLMKNKIEIDHDQFLSAVGLSVNSILDEDESWSEYRDNTERSDSLRYYKHKLGHLYFFQTMGFEYIFIK